jgi:hypothetical protein
MFSWNLLCPIGSETMRSQKTINERQSIKLGLIAGCGKALVLRIPCGVCRRATLRCLLVIHPMPGRGKMSMASEHTGSYREKKEVDFIGISILRGKRESEKSWRNEEGNRKNWSEKQGRQGLDRKNAAFMPVDLSSNPCRPCFSERAAGDCAGIETHVSRQSSGCSCGHPRQSSNDCSEFETAAGGGLGWKGSWAFERGLSRCCRIRSTTRGSGDR